MKSITQINLGFLTEMKSLSESDSGMLQASQLIASGGAGLVSRYLCFTAEVKFIQRCFAQPLSMT